MSEMGGHLKYPTSAEPLIRPVMPEDDDKSMISDNLTSLREQRQTSGLFKSELDFMNNLDIGQNRNSNAFAMMVNPALKSRRKQAESEENLFYQANFKNEDDDISQVDKDVDGLAISNISGIQLRSKPETSDEYGEVRVDTMTTNERKSDEADKLYESEEKTDDDRAKSFNDATLIKLQKQRGKLKQMFKSIATSAVVTPEKDRTKSVVSMVSCDSKNLQFENRDQFEGYLCTFMPKDEGQGANENPEAPNESPEEFERERTFAITSNEKKGLGFEELRSKLKIDLESMRPQQEQTRETFQSQTVHHQSVREPKKEVENKDKEFFRITLLA